MGDFNSPKKYKRFDYTLASGKKRFDVYQPFTPEERFQRYVDPADVSAQPVVPTPVKYSEKSSKKVDIVSGEWKICLSHDSFSKEAKYLSAAVYTTMQSRTNMLFIFLLCHRGAKKQKVA